MYNVGGAIAWIGLFVFGGYFFGTIPAVEENFSLVIMAIIALSILPAVIEYVRQRRVASR
jgi:membrane-associated protein